MTNYKFNEVKARKIDVVILFKLLIGLIEIQRQSALYLAGAKCDLDCTGICSNVYDLLEEHGTNQYVDLAQIFFKGKCFPLVPYYADTWSSNEQDKVHRWGDTPTGKKRREMLARMIKDLTNYLTNKAL